MTTRRQPFNHSTDIYPMESLCNRHQKAVAQNHRNQRPRHSRSPDALLPQLCSQHAKEVYKDQSRSPPSCSQRSLSSCAQYATVSVIKHSADCCKNTPVQRLYGESDSRASSESVRIGKSRHNPNKAHPAVTSAERRHPPPMLEPLYPVLGGLMPPCDCLQLLQPTVLYVPVQALGRPVAYPHYAPCACGSLPKNWRRGAAR